MRREYLYLLGGLGLLAGTLLWLSSQRTDFSIYLPREGFPPGTQVLFVQLKRPLSPSEALPSFSLEPEVPILRTERLQADAILLLLSTPLEAGQTYTLRASPSEGTSLRGKMRIPVQPLRVRVSPKPYLGPEGQPAILLTANGRLPEKEGPELLPRSRSGSKIPVQWAKLSPKEALLLLGSSASEVEIPSLQKEDKEILGAQVVFPPDAPLEIRETTVEEQAGKLRVRLRFNQWIEPYRNTLAAYLRLDEGMPFTVEAQGIDAFLYPEKRPLTTFRVQVQAGFPGKGRVLKETASFLLSPPAQEERLAWFQPYVHFISPGTPLLFQATGCEEVELTVWRILPQNTRLFFRQKAENLWITYPTDLEGFWWEGTYWWGWEGCSPLEAYGEKIRQSKIPLTALGKVTQKGQTLYAIGNDLPPGIYTLEITGKSWQRLRTWVVISDYALIARQWTEGMAVWAVHQQTGEPLRGVKIEVWGPAGQFLGAGITDAQGHLSLSLEGEPEGIWAEWKGQPNYLTLRGLRPGRWGFETQGIDPARSRYMVYMQPGRTLFRPGETFTLAGFVRTADLKYPGPLTLSAELRDPQYRSIWRGSLSLDRTGAWNWQYTLPLSAPTGEYRLLVSLPDKGETVGELPFQVEFFRPNRLSVSVRGEALSAKQATAQVQAAFLYGAPGSHLEGQLDLRWTPLSPTGPHAEGYVWTVSVPDSALSAFRKALSFSLDAQGIRRLSLPVPKGWGYGEITMTARVKDDEGRPNFSSYRLPFLSQPTLVGMKKLPAYVDSETPLTVPLRALSGDSLRLTPQSVAVRVEVLERQYEYLLVETAWGSLRHEYRPVERLIHKGVAEIQAGEGAFQFTPKVGEYEIRIWAPGQVYPLIQRVEAWGWGGSSVLRGDPEGWIEISPQKTQYEVGEKARLLLKLPLEGQVLLTVERDKVFFSRWLRPSDRTTEIEIPLQSHYAPGVYVHVIAVHTTEKELPFRISRGMLYLPVQDKSLHLTPQIVAPERALPGTSIQVQVKGLPAGTQIVLAGVDMGLLALQKREIGSPYDYFYQKRAHAVRVAEQLPYSAPWSSRVVGGDQESTADEERAGLTETVEKAVAFFWGELRADKNGAVRVEVPLPAFTGRIRWRAYALTESTFGMGEAYTTVATPVVARISLPPFLSEGDELQLTLRLQNTTTTPQQGTWKLSMDGRPILSFSSTQGTFALPVGAQRIEKLYVRATAPVGRVKVQLEVQGRILQEQEVRLRPPEAPQRVLSTYQVAPGTEEQLVLPGEAFLPTTRSVRLIAGGLPMVYLVGSLWDLIQFPHGCGEQITSKAFATLTAGTWLKALTGFPEDTLRAYVLHALEKLKSHMSPEGGFAYWPGGPSDTWLSVYVAHFLYEAHKAGYAKATPLWEKALAYQKALLPTYGPASRTQAYRALLLAQALKAEVRSYFPSHAEVERIPDPAIRSLWRGAFSLAGLPLPSPSAEKVQWSRQYEGELISPLRENALELYGESFVPSDKRSSTWREKVLEESFYRFSGSLSTQEAAWLLLALSRAVEPQATRATMALPNRTLSLPSPIAGEDLTTYAGQEVVLKNTGHTPLYAAVLAQGIPSQRQPATTSGLRLSSFFREEGTGRTIAPSAMTPGQRLRWVIQIEAPPSSLPLANVALTVPIAAGWQAENPRLLPEDPVSGRSSEGMHLTYVDRREDRLLYYFTLTQSQAKVEVPFQVLYAGQYAIPSLSIVAMYDPSLFATTASERGQVRPLP